MEAISCVFWHQGKWEMVLVSSVGPLTSTLSPSSCSRAWNSLAQPDLCVPRLVHPPGSASFPLAPREQVGGSPSRTVILSHSPVSAGIALQHVSLTWSLKRTFCRERLLGNPSLNPGREASNLLAGGMPMAPFHALLLGGVLSSYQPEADISPCLSPSETNPPPNLLRVSLQRHVGGWPAEFMGYAHLHVGIT